MTSKDEMHDDETAAEHRRRRGGFRLAWEPARTVCGTSLPYESAQSSRAVESGGGKSVRVECETGGETRCHRFSVFRSSTAEGGRSMRSRCNLPLAKLF